MYTEDIAVNPPQTRPSRVFYREFGRELPKIVRGEGVYLCDSEGKRYLDASGGAMVCNIGHGVAEVAEAIGRQAHQLAYVNGTAFTNEPAEELAEYLTVKAPPGLGRVYFLNSGSEATEAALKLARQYHVERGELQRRIIIAQTPGYHGNTLLALSVSARERYRAMYGPWLTDDVVMIDAPYPYRRAGIDDGSALEDAIVRAGAQNVAAFIAEPVGGSSTGASVASPRYFERVREICDFYGVLFICDEVLSGAGRTGRYFGIEHFSGADRNPVSPDIITMGKGLNGGYAPLSALLVRDTLVETVTGGSGNFMHAQTFSHNPMACAAGLAVQRYIDKHALVTRADRVGRALGERLSKLRRSGAACSIGDIRGIGMLWAIEFVANRETKRPFPRKVHFAETLVEEAQKNGLVLWPNVGSADGTDGDIVMIAPPFTITLEEIEELATRLEASIITTIRRSLV